jgi:SWI/SNF-related matrix-associated actin-dependent regulator 1 of chromatin subfamily A
VRHRYDGAAVEEIITLTHARGVFGPDAPLKKVREHVESLSDFALHALCGEPRLRDALAHRRLPPEAALDSGKSRRLATLLPALRDKGSRPLIFSQWKIMLDVLEWVMASLGLSYYRLDGSTPVRHENCISARARMRKAHRIAVLLTHSLFFLFLLFPLAG